VTCDEVDLFAKCVFFSPPPPLNKYNRNFSYDDILPELSGVTVQSVITNTVYVFMFNCYAKVLHFYCELFIVELAL